MMQNSDFPAIPAVFPAGERALVLDFGNVIDDAVNDRVTAYRAGIEKARIPGILEVVPTYRSLLVLYDPCIIRYDSLKEKLRAVSSSGTGAAGGVLRLLSVPCLYGGEAGPDLSALSSMTGLPEEEIVRLHSAPDYKIYMLGFLPGFVYLGGLDSRICAPRLSTPRTRIPAGSVGIGGSQTGVYPVDSPGGWRLIGKTPLRFYDPAGDPPILCRAGDRIRFRPVGADEYEAIRRKVEEGTYSPEFTAWKGGTE